MFQLLFAALLATATPAMPAPGEDTQITLTGDPVKDAPIICLTMVAEKVENALAGKPAISVVLPAYSVAYKLTGEQTEKLVRECTFFETGFLVGVNAERNGMLNKADPEPENKGLTTAF